MKRTILAVVIGAFVLALVSPTVSSWALGRGGNEVQRPSGDVNGDGTRSLGDAVYLLQFLFSSGPAPVEPQEPEASPELIAAIQTAADKLLERMPTEEERASLRPFRASITDPIIYPWWLLREQSQWTQAAATAVAAKLQHHIVLYSISIAYGKLVESHHSGENAHTECLDRCYPAYLQCRSLCSDAVCELDCAIHFMECVEDCLNE